MDIISSTLDYLLQHEAGILESITAIVGFSRLITALTPTKADDKILARPEMWWRKLLDLITGACHKPLIETTNGDNAESQPSPTPPVQIPPPMAPPQIVLDKPTPRVRGSFQTLLTNLDELGAEFVVRRK